MDDELKIKKIKKIIRLIIIIFILIVSISVGIYYYHKHLIKVNTERFEKYITNNNYSSDINDEIYYTLYTDGHILTKTTKLDENVNSNVSVSYDNDGKISGTLELYGTNIYGNVGVSYLKSTYQSKKFDCEFISNKGFTAKCNILKTKSEEFEKEMKDIFKNSKTKAKYINTK